MFGDRRASDCGFSFVRRRQSAAADADGAGTAGRAFLFIGAVSFVTECTADWSRVVALANFMNTAILWSSAKSGGRARAGASRIIGEAEANQICECNVVLCGGVVA